MSRPRYITLFDVGQASQPFPVLEAGEYPSRGLTVTEGDLDKMVANFQKLTAEGVEFSLDYDHSFAEGGSSEASGWYRDLYREGRRLFARVEWTDTARQKIKDGLFKFFSAEFHLAWRDESDKEWGPTMLAGTLTNRPFLKRLGPVALSERAADEIAADVPDEIVDRLAGRVAERSPAAAERRAEMSDDKTVTLTEAEHQELVAKAKKADEASDSDGQIQTLTAKVESLQEAVDGHKERADNLDAELRDERLTALLAQARREGRIDSKDETTQKWAERAKTLGLDTVKELLAELPAETIPMSERGHGGDKPGTSTTEVPDGTNEQAHRAHVRAEQIAQEREISYEDAAPIAFREIYEGATA